MRIGFDAKRAFNNKTGLGNYSRFILNALQKFASEHTYLAYTPKIKTGLFDEFPTDDIRLPISKTNFMVRGGGVMELLKVSPKRAFNFFTVLATSFPPDSKRQELNRL